MAHFKKQMNTFENNLQAKQTIFKQNLKKRTGEIHNDVVRKRKRVHTGQWASIEPVRATIEKPYYREYSIYATDIQKRAMADPRNVGASPAQAQASQELKGWVADRIDTRLQHFVFNKITEFGSSPSNRKGIALYGSPTQWESFDKTVYGKVYEIAFDMGWVRKQIEGMFK